MDDGDFTTFAAVSGPRLLRFGVLLCGSPAQAEDLAQEALTRVYLRWDRLRRENPEAYARRTMVNLQTSWWRSPWSARRDPVVPDRAGADQYAGADDRQVVLSALATLPARMRAVVVLRYWLGFSEQGTAAELGVSVGAVKSRGSRGLARLRDQLTDRTGRVLSGLVPYGLFFLIAVAYTAGAARSAGQGALVQQVNAIESVSNVDVVCADKTGTLTTGKLTVDEVLPLGGHDLAEVRETLVTERSGRDHHRRGRGRPAPGPGRRERPRPARRRSRARRAPRRPWPGRAVAGGPACAWPGSPEAR
ncbi:SigE family RNA polymerase sigma factor [Actinoplanes sp. NPDC048796]|uniref:SigE family RNA polymerase sigma factor n=1 Tax=Actinoplanes sp. NPDC048796 TaxID=3155640 RepID=UPI0033FF53D7